MVKKGMAAITQLRIQWSNLPADATTWEDYDVLRHRFPDTIIWDDAATQGGANVMPVDHVQITEPQAV